MNAGQLIFPEMKVDKAPFPVHTIDLKNNMKDKSDVPWCKKLIVGSKQETKVQAMGNPT